MINSKNDVDIFDGGRRNSEGEGKRRRALLSGFSETFSKLEKKALSCKKAPTCNRVRPLYVNTDSPTLNNYSRLKEVVGPTTYPLSF